MIKNCIWVLVAISWFISSCSANADQKANQEANQEQEQEQEIAAQVSQAIDAFANSKRKDWAVTITHYENEEGDVTTRIEQYNPIAADKWTLISVNDQAPNRKQLKQYALNKQEQKDKTKEKGNSISIDLKTFIKQGTLKLIEQNSKEAQLVFDVNMPRLGDEAIDKLAGKLIYNKEHQFIETITVVNTDEFSPMFSATISDFKAVFEFDKKSNAILPMHYKMQFKGSFALFTTIDEVSTTIFSDYHHKSALGASSGEF